MTSCSIAVVIAPAADARDARFFGLTASERLARAFERAGLETVAPESIARHETARVVVLSADYVVEERVIDALVASPQDVILEVATPSGPRAVGAVGPGRSIAAVLPMLHDAAANPSADAQSTFARVQATDLVPAFDPKLRKIAAPVVVPASAANVAEVEKLVFAAAYKGTTDFITKFAWPRPARAVTAWCANRGIQPNLVTALSYVLTAVTLVAFWQGDFAIGLVSAWVMTFLDTVDGKLARVTLTSSTLGDVLDHGLDMIHPPFWWLAWAVGLTGAGATAGWDPTLLFGDHTFLAAVLFFGYIVGRLLEGLFILLFGQEMFNWRAFDRAFRLVIARRNPNLLLLTVGLLAGAPELALVSVGVWTVACIAIQCVRIVQAAIAGETAEIDASA